MFFKSAAKVNCYVFHFLNEKEDAREMVVLLHRHFLEIYDARLISFFSFDYKYKSYNDKLETALRHTDDRKWNEMDSILMSSDPYLDTTKTLLVSYDITRPSEIVIALKNDRWFDMVRFGKLLYEKKSLFYAYKYSTTGFMAITAYPGGGVENRKSIREVPSSRLKEKVIFRWRKDWEKIYEGFLRDIYTENILTRRQMNRELGHQTLLEMIRHNQWGQVEQIENELYYWKIDKELLSKVGKALHRHGIFI